MVVTVDGPFPVVTERVMMYTSCTKSPTKPLSDMGEGFSLTRSIITILTKAS